MRTQRLVSALLAAMLSAGCLVVSLQPVYQPETIAFDPALLGTWVTGDEPMTLTIERGEWHSYHVTIDERDERMRLSGRMTRVGEHTYLDVAPLDGADLPALSLPVHAVYRMELKDGELRLAEFDYETLERRLEEGTAGLPMVIDARKNLVITAATGPLRQWLAGAAGDEALFDAPVVFTRPGAEAEDEPKPR